jgi:hypothetical protein
VTPRRGQSKLLQKLLQQGTPLIFCSSFMLRSTHEAARDLVASLSKVAASTPQQPSRAAAVGLDPDAAEPTKPNRGIFSCRMQVYFPIVGGLALLVSDMQRSDSRAAGLLPIPWDPCCPGSLLTQPPSERNFILAIFKIGPVGRSGQLFSPPRWLCFGRQFHSAVLVRCVCVCVCFKASHFSKSISSIR